MLFEGVSLFGNTIKQYLTATAIIVLAFAIGKIAYWLLSSTVRTFTSKTKTRLDDLILDLVDRPIVFLIGLGGLYFGLQQLSLSVRAAETLDKVVLILLALNVAWVVINLIDAAIKNFFKPVIDRKGKAVVDDGAARAVAKLVKIVIWLIVIILVITNLGFDVTALLTGLGLGGLAFALAAQDLLANLFGGFAILSDKPFKVGDRVRFSSDKDGFVREIGFRTTRIQTLDGTMLVVPNSELAKTTVENISKEPARRVVMKIGLEYHTTIAQVKLAEDILKDVFLKNTNLTDDSYVGFSDFGDFALIITAIYFIKDPSKQLDVKSEVNREIKHRFEKAGLQFAYPTQHLILTSQPAKASRKKQSLS
jgi:MscS family membrane protein